MRSFPFEGVVVVADLLTDSGERGAYSARRDLEQTEEPTLDEICSAIESLGLQVQHCANPAQLASSANAHSSDVVLSIYGGALSRSRMALVPAICEALDLRYVGPDAYGRIIAQDKEISKRLAADCGLVTPPWRVIRSRGEADSINSLTPPIVVKPLLEGSSIGISPQSLQTSHEGARAAALDLLERFAQPVIVEQFVAGREVSYNRIEGDGPTTWSFSEVIITGDGGYFEHRLFDAEEKMIRRPGRTVANIDSDLSGDERARLERFLGSIGRYGYCRVDGRLNEGTFAFIELTPDAWLGRLGQFAMGFTEKGWSYEQVLAEILLSAG
jgi:D-alanine-D-alanine ligase